jgi:hypothetical protein
MVPIIERHSRGGRRRPSAARTRVALAATALILVTFFGHSPAFLGASPPLVQNFGDWSAPVSVDPQRLLVNTSVNDGCPMEGLDGLTLFIASDRLDEASGKITPDLDLWVAYRTSEEAPWSEMVRLPAPVNTGAAEFCPTPLPGNRLLFVRTQLGCGGVVSPDIYITQLHPVHGWLPPQSLGCEINSPFQEFSPSLVEAGGVTTLYFSSNRGGANHKLYASVLQPDGSWATPEPISGLNMDGFDDARPNVRKDGLEIVFDSNRLGTFDIFTATRAGIADPWGAPEPVDVVNSHTAHETRASISREGTRLYFGSTRANVPGDSGGDIFVASRTGPGRNGGHE